MGRKSKREKTFDLSTVKFNVKKYNPYDLNAIKEVQETAIEIAKKKPNISPEYYFVHACIEYMWKHNETYMDILKRRYGKKEIDKRDFNFKECWGKFLEEVFSSNPWLEIEASVYEDEDKEESEVPAFDPFEISKDEDFVSYISSAMHVYKKDVMPFYLYFYDACEDYIMDKCGYEDLSDEFDADRYTHFHNEMLKSNPWMDGLMHWHEIACMSLFIRHK